ncbi:MAG TPA: hypothetical protein VF104_09975 [Burkholderiales bacterium]
MKRSPRVRMSDLDLPYIAHHRDEVPARLYNLWRLARSRLGLPLRLELPGLKGLELVLGETSWVCRDPQLNDFPVVAWTDFQVAGRRALNAPVACELRYYHMGGSKVRLRVMDLMGEILEQRLAAPRRAR